MRGVSEGWAGPDACALSLCPRQCALAALRDVKAYLTKEGGQISVSLGVRGSISNPVVGWRPGQREMETLARAVASWGPLEQGQGPPARDSGEAGGPSSAGPRAGGQGAAAAGQCAPRPSSARSRRPSRHAGPGVHPPRPRCRRHSFLCFEGRPSPSIPECGWGPARGGPWAPTGKGQAGPRGVASAARARRGFPSRPTFSLPIRCSMPPIRPERGDT